jgi:hypothetical protein
MFIRCVSAVLSLSIALPVATLAAQSPAAKPTAAAAEAPDPAWMVDLGKRHQTLIDRNGPGTDAALRDRLLKMKDEDQAAPERGIAKVSPEDKAKYQASANLHETDTKLTAELKEIIAKDGWPTIALVGYDASNAAMLILTHTRDHAWQLGLLPQLEELADKGKIDGSALALVIDKELVAEGQLQRYGSQFKVLPNGEIAMYGVEDPATLDARRARVFLPPMDWYTQQLEQMYHVKASKQVVMATPPAK